MLAESGFRRLVERTERLNRRSLKSGGCRPAIHGEPHHEKERKEEAEPAGARRWLAVLPRSSPWIHHRHEHLDRPRQEW